MERPFDGKVVLVTGGASGIGRATSLRFAVAGAVLVIADVNVAGGEETAHMIHGQGGEAVFFRTDVARGEDVEAMVRQAVARYGRLDCAFNNAGLPGGGAVADCTEEDWAAVIAVNLTGVWLCMKHEIRQMLRQGKGAIVNTASVMGLVATPGACAYSASKHGVVGLTRSAAVAYAKAGIRVNAVCPGLIDTPMTAGIPAEFKDPFRAQHPIGRAGTPQEVAEAVVWLCSDAASYVTGHAMAIDGAYVAQ
ncbi:MAG: short chain dehydrogenase [Deltaproteobacteria bacterium]|nr:short chain dehydrogenase [Deltaproteobacteria bacterium]